MNRITRKNNNKSYNELVEEYGRKILAEHGCNEYTYGDEKAETVLNDLKTEYPDGMEFPYVDVANAIKRISKPHMIERKPFAAIWSTYDCCDCILCKTFEEAKETTINILTSWQAEATSEWKSGTPTEEEVSSWDGMILECEAYVGKYNPDKDDYDDYWLPDDQDLKEIGWCVWDERRI